MVNCLKGFDLTCEIMIEKIFFELLQVAIGNRDELSRILSAREWNELYEIAKKQSLMGVCFAGVRRLGFSSYKN